MIERRNGTIRNKRLNQDLLDNSFQIDQRSFWDIMGYISSYLQKINYYDLHNQPSRDWVAMIEGDPIIYMVVIINQPLTDLNQMAQSVNETKVCNVDNLEMATNLLNWYDKINEWYKNLLNQGEHRLANKIKNVLSDVLDNPKNNLLLFQQKLIREQQKTESTPKVHLLKSMPPPPKPTGDVDLDKMIHTFQKVIMHIQNFTKDYLEQNILTANNHMPNNAMYIAFSLLLKRVQGDINSLSKRHLDFYYQDILQQKKSKGLPTKTTVSFDLLPAVQYSLIEKGAQLTAGKLFGSKTDVLFQTEKPIVAYQMELVELQTLTFNSNPYIRVGTDQPLVSSISKNDLIIKGKEVTPQDEWFVFGANKQTLQNTQINEGKVANLGFIIGSSVLFLSEGKRTIDIQVNMEPVSAQNTFWNLLNQIKTNRKIGMDTVFSAVFDQSLKISYTTKKGWVNFNEYAIEYNEAANYFTIQLVLENFDPSLEPSTEIEQPLKWPSIKVELNEFAPIYLYSFWKGLAINTIDIDVDVQRIRNLSLYNNIGKITLGKAFDLFGPVPTLGSFLMIGKSEFFKKQLTAMSIHLDWDSVPNDFGGFDTYYDAYPEEITNDSFNVQLTALSNNYWLPTDLKFAPTFNLFATHNSITPEGYQSVQLNPSTDIELTQFSELGTTQDFNLQDPLKYEVTSQSGFIKLTLTSPNFGFGSDLYQKEYIEVATYNAKNKTQLPYPNKPFIPKIKDLSVDYKASDTLVFNEELSKTTISLEAAPEFMHITPFGIEEIINNQNVSEHTLVCDYEQEGYLFIGLKGVKSNTTVAIFFHFLQSSTGINIDKDALTWEYFQVNRWVKFEEGNIILDKTNGFIKSGIIEFLLPKVEGIGEKGNQQLYWIRISTPKNTAYYPKIKGIYLNAVEATCISDDGLVMGKEVPAESITKLVGKFPDIKKVNQPVNSSGGVLQEAEDQFYTGISERLRHKGRALSIWDHEHLVLSNFNDVKVVKCTNLDETFNPLPGKVKIIVLSANWTNDERHYFDGDRLQQMKTFLKKLSTPFVDIEVVNPTVEYLLANCVVEFKPEDNGGYYLNLLNENISDFLSPMSSIDNGLGGIGGSVVPTMLVSFLENLPYVQNIKKLTIEHIVREGINNYSLGVYKDGEEIKTTKPWSILSPVKEHHIVSVINKNQNYDLLDVGVGNMEIGLDLILGDNNNDNATVVQSLIKATHPEDKITEVSNDAILVFKNK